MDNDTLGLVLIVLVIIYICKKSRMEGLTLYPRPELSNEFSLPDNVSEKRLLKDYPRHEPPTSGQTAQFVFNSTVDKPPAEFVYDTPFKYGQGASRDHIFGYDKYNYMTDVNQVNQLDGHTSSLDTHQTRNSAKKRRKAGMAGYQSINWQAHAPLINPITEDDIKRYMSSVEVSKSHVQYVPTQMNPYYKPLKYMPVGPGWLQ